MNALLGYAPFATAAFRCVRRSSLSGPGLAAAAVIEILHLPMEGVLAFILLLESVKKSGIGRSEVVWRNG
jgi:hypothetical protein